MQAHRALRAPLATTALTTAAPAMSAGSAQAGGIGVGAGPTGGNACVNHGGADLPMM
ncbi:hypothetical protein [Streptomyces cyaneogriseus]|uniref:hypothetical protein n=1 Tax=Streptomyces cyaneogriseus TaxID=68192 RepID=UPI000AE32982|nr:hypothetical protein [Streptomyces cyaneogriseus]